MRKGVSDQLIEGRRDSLLLTELTIPPKSKLMTVPYVATPFPILRL
jgi:hypothetical protein